jgi:hypothetical protein
MEGFWESRVSSRGFPWTCRARFRNHPHSLGWFDDSSSLFRFYT